MVSSVQSLENVIRSSSHALVIGVGGGGDVVGALAAARFLEFCGLQWTLGGLSWERYVYDPLPGPRSLEEIENIKPLHHRMGLAGPQTRTKHGVYFAESKMAEVLGKDVLLVDINGGVKGVVEGLKVVINEFKTDLLVGLDVGGDSLAEGGEKGLRSPLADSVMLAALAELEQSGVPTLWGVYGYASDGELSTDEVERALSVVAKAGGFQGAWALTPKVVEELSEVIQKVQTEASAIPVECALGAWGEKSIRRGERSVKLTPLTALTFFLSPTVVFKTLSRPARALATSASLEEADAALHAMGLRTELDLERERYRKKA
ncbi:MAG: DUF1152 domain-containing protein [Deltaproteobacteria bacterium]|nr:DUF1152 domain-containing protein [Deltaproteobacteria bacterium]